jgi:hypothetical protein
VLASALSGFSSTHAQSGAANSESLESSPWTWDHCLSGITYGQPFKLAISYAQGFVRESRTGGADYCAFAAAKVGFGAARGSIGFGRTAGTLGTGMAINGGVLRTFGSSWGATPKRTYVGAALNLWPVFGLGGEIGYYLRVGDKAGAGTHQRRIITWSAGFGF